MLVRTVEKGSVVETYVTAQPRLGVDLESSAREVFEELAQFMVERGIQPIQEKIYGLTEAQDTILQIREEAFTSKGADAELPATYLEGRPLSETAFGGIQLWGIRANGENRELLATVPSPYSGVARCWSVDGARFMYMPAVRGTALGERSCHSASCEAEVMIENAAKTLMAYGFPLLNVIRTWIYLSDILKWYGEFNEVRNDLFRDFGLLGPQGTNVFPASTGIEGKTGDGVCMMDLLAVDCADSEMVQVQPITVTGRQEESFNYGSAFSRGYTLTQGGKRTVFVSGTASINAAGETIHLNDPEAQVMQTLLNVATLLEEQGTSLSNICAATVFCKDETAYRAYTDVCRKLCIPNFPAIAVQADVCRSDLLVEIEAVAIAPSRSLN